MQGARKSIFLNRRDFITLLGSAAASPFAAVEQIAFAAPAGQESEQHNGIARISQGLPQCGLSAHTAGTTHAS